MRYLSPALALVFIVAACARDADRGPEAQPSSEATMEAGDRTDTYGDRLGTVMLAASCSDEANLDVERGVALLHSMTYEGAGLAFATAVEADPHCAMGYWGQAMSFVHPLWHDPPDRETFERGRSLLTEASTRGRKTDRERGYIAALEEYYAAGWSDDETPNLRGFERGWAGFHREFPDDVEGAAFFALAQLGTADPGDKSYRKQLAAGRLAEQVLKRVPDHPGALHYIIHAYDNPALADRAVSVARSYSDVAPEVPHALHMPTHTFTRLGLWRESIDWNRRSADAALKHPVGDSISTHYFHALDYLAYAYLQGAEDRKAEAIQREIEESDPPFQAHIATTYALAAVPARLALERRRWKEAAALEPRTPRSYSWGTAPALQGITYFARALGAARSGDRAAARAALEELADIQQGAAAASPYWGTQTEVQRLSALAWLEYEEGRPDDALATMRSAAELEASTEKHPVTPGEILPARELLGDMLLELERASEALGEYETALARSPNRFNSLLGAGRAAELSGDDGAAAKYYRELVRVAEQADAERGGLDHAREFVAAHPE